MPPHQIHIVQHRDDGATLRVPVFDHRQQQRVVAASTAVNGSSSRIRRASCTIVRANSTRWNWPADSAWIGRASISASPTRVQSRPGRRHPVVADRPKRTQPGGRQSHDVAAGDRETSDPSGCPAPTARYRPVSARPRSIRPAASGCSPAIARSSVVLPDPFGADQRGQAAGTRIVPDNAGQDDPRAVPQFDVIQRDHSAQATAAHTRRAPPAPGKGGRSRRRSGTSGSIMVTV